MARAADDDNEDEDEAPPRPQKTRPSPMLVQSDYRGKQMYGSWFTHVIIIHAESVRSDVFFTTYASDL